METESKSNYFVTILSIISKTVYDIRNYTKQSETFNLIYAKLKDVSSLIMSHGIPLLFILMNEGFKLPGLIYTTAITLKSMSLKEISGLLHEKYETTINKGFWELLSEWRAKGTRFIGSQFDIDEDSCDSDDEKESLTLGDLIKGNLTDYDSNEDDEYRQPNSEDLSVDSLEYRSTDNEDSETPITEEEIKETLDFINNKKKKENLLSPLEVEDRVRSQSVKV